MKATTLRKKNNKKNKATVRNNKKTNLNAARGMLSRKVLDYYDEIQQEMKAGEKIPPKLRRFIIELIKEDMKNMTNKPITTNNMNNKVKELAK